MSKEATKESISRIEMHTINILKVFQYIGVGCILILMIITVINSIGRYGFSRPVLGVIEISDFLMLMSAFLVGAYTMVNKSHVTIGIFVDRFSPRGQAIIDSFTYIFSLIMVCLAGWRSLVNGLYIMDQKQATDILHIPHFPFYMVVAFGWFILGIAILLQLIHFVGEAVKK